MTDDLVTARVLVLFLGTVEQVRMNCKRSAPGINGCDSLRFHPLYLRLTELHQLQDVAFQAVVFGSGVGEDVDKGSGQRNLQSFLYGSDAHLWAVATTLRDRIACHRAALVERLGRL